MATNMIRQVKVGTTNYDINSVRTGGILYGKVDASSTSTAYTATIEGLDGCTAYYDGLTVLLKNGVVTSASGFTININGLGAKQAYSNMAAATAETTIFDVNYTMLFIYDSTRVSGGGWVMYRGYNSNDNTIGYQLRTNSTAMKVSDAARYYKIYFTSADNTQWVPASVNSTNNATTKRAVNQRPINPFGRIVYTSASTNYTAGSTLAATTIWSQYNVTLGYSFNRTGAALTLTSAAPVYIKCAPQANGSAIIDAGTPYVQALPSTEDGKIYIYLGVATSATQVEIYQDHPVYCYKDGGIHIWPYYVHPSYEAAEAAAVKIGRDAQGHVVIGGELNLGDVGGVSPMKFKGTIGNTSAATVTAVPTSDVTEGDVWKIIEANKSIATGSSTNGTAFTAKIGDLIIATAGGSSPKWVLVPSGDEPSGTVTSVGISNATNGGLSISSSPITSSGTISVGHSNILTSAQTTQALYPIAIDKNGHISSYGTAVTLPTDPILTVSDRNGTESFELDHGSTMFYYNTNVLTDVSLSGGSFPTVDTSKFSGGSAASLTSSLGASNATAANPTTLTISFSGGSPASISSGFYSGGSFPTLNKDSTVAISGLTNQLAQPM